MTNPALLFEGRFLRLVQRDKWEYVTRPQATGVVAVVALHDDGRVVLVEQHRPAVDARVIELPAGLAGDADNSESLLTAARRELEEETGYTAREWVRLPAAYSSPGLTDEIITFFLARGLTKSSDGGGVDTESITLHEIPVTHLNHWLTDPEAPPRLVDMKLLAGLHLVTTTPR